MYGSIVQSGKGRDIDYLLVPQSEESFSLSAEEINRIRDRGFEIKKIRDDGSRDHYLIKSGSKLVDLVVDDPSAFDYYKPVKRLK